MKKISFFLLAMIATVVMPFTFTSCGEENGPEPEDTTDVKPPVDNTVIEETMSVVQAQYAGMVLAQNAYTYQFVATTDGVSFDQEGAPIGDGYMVVMLLQDSKEKDVEIAPFPEKKGTYDLADTGAPGTAIVGMEQDGEQMGCFAFKVEDDDVSEVILFVEGSVTLEGSADSYSIVMEAVGDDDNDYKFTSKNSVKVVNGIYGNESPNVTTVNVTATKASGVNYTDKLVKLNNAELVDIFIESEKEACELWLAVPVGTGLASLDKLVGEYPLNMTGQAKTALASMGFDGRMHYPSWLMVNKQTIQNQTVFGGVYYFMSGKVVVAADKITVEATTFYGSTVKVEYTGTFTLEEPKQSQSAAAKSFVPSVEMSPVMNMIRF